MTDDLSASPAIPVPRGGLGIEVLVVTDCPNRQTAIDRLRTALDTLGAPPATISERTIDDPADADAAGMHGSPTIRINGHDPFAGPDAEERCTRLQEQLASVEALARNLQAEATEAQAAR